MPPLHRIDNNHHIAVVDDDDEHDDFDDDGEDAAVFLPLDHRRWSDASDVSAYCIHPDDQALRRHDYHRLRPKKVAVIGFNLRGITCASTLQQDGHQVTVLEGASMVDTSEPQGCHRHQHPDFTLEEYRSDDNLRGLTYTEACAAHFDVTVKGNIGIIEMKEKFGGWVLTYSNHTEQSNEYFDYVVLAESSSADERTVDRPVSRFHQQYLLPLWLGMAWIFQHLRNAWTILVPRSAQVHHASEESSFSYSYLPAEYHFKPQLYRRMISHNIPRVAFLGESDFTCIQSAWLSTLLYDEMNLEHVRSQVSSIKHASTIRFNDVLMQDLGLNPHRKDSMWEELLGAYTPQDYRGVLNEIQQRRRISQREGWAVPLTPMPGDL